MLDASAAVATLLASGGLVIFAYVDPGTGSYLLQIALAGLLGAGYALRHFWSEVKRVVGRATSRAEPAAPADPTGAAPSTAAGADDPGR
jgi:hypothetical protein